VPDLVERHPRDVVVQQRRHRRHEVGVHVERLRVPPDELELGVLDHPVVERHHRQQADGGQPRRRLGTAAASSSGEIGDSRSTSTTSPYPNTVSAALLIPRRSAAESGNVPAALATIRLARSTATASSGGTETII
jgi:hypothetical protein